MTILIKNGREVPVAKTLHRVVSVHCTARLQEPPTQIVARTSSATLTS